MNPTVVLSIMLNFPVQAAVTAIVVACCAYLSRRAIHARRQPVTRLNRALSYGATIVMIVGTLFIIVAMVVAVWPASFH